MTNWKTKIRKNSTHVVVYRGAPYGENEGGHITSQHRSFAAAAACCRPYDYKVVVALDEPYDRSANGETAREYFATVDNRAAYKD